MALLDLLGRRWTLRILWELRSETLGFRELQARCDEMSASVLNQRLVELREAGIVESGDGYQLTPRGTELLKAFKPLERWAKAWRPHPDTPAYRLPTADYLYGPVTLITSRTTDQDGLKLPKSSIRPFSFTGGWGRGFPPAQPGFTRKSRRFQTSAPLTHGF